MNWQYPQGPWTPYSPGPPPNVIYIPIPTPPEDIKPSKKRRRYSESSESSSMTAFLQELDESERMIKFIKEKYSQKEGEKKKEEQKKSSMSTVEWAMLLVSFSALTAPLQLLFVAKMLGW